MVEEKKVSALAEGAARDPLEGFDLDTLLAGAARLRPNRAAITDGALDLAQTLTYAGLDAKVSALAGGWRHLGVSPGERILIVSDARPTPFIATLAALRARIDVVLLPSSASADEISNACARTQAIAIARQPIAADDELPELFGAAAQASGVRLVVSLGGATPEAVALPEVSDSSLEQIRPLPHASVLTVRADGSIAVHAQRTLVAAALDFISQARIGMRTPILSTIAPGRFAGLVAGPIAGLMAGAPVILHGPFHSREFLELLERVGPTHLVAPASLLEPLAQAGLLSEPSFSTLVLLERCAIPDDLPDLTRPVAPLEGRTPPIVDLVAVGEEAIIAEPRGPDGSPLPLASATHYLSLDGRSIPAVALERLRIGVDGETVERILLSGAAVSVSGETPNERSERR